MNPSQLFDPALDLGLGPRDPSLANPRPSLLARYLQSRLEAEKQPPGQAAPASSPVSLPAGVRQDLRPVMPRIGMAAVMLFSQRRAVQSYPLLYTALALAHPN